MGAKEPPREENYVPRDEEITADVLEVSGSVKWFDPAKGYGFILPNDDLPDVLLHVICDAMVFRLPMGAHGLFVTW